MSPREEEHEIANLMYLEPVLTFCPLSAVHIHFPFLVWEHLRATLVSSAMKTTAKRKVCRCLFLNGSVLLCWISGCDWNTVLHRHVPFLLKAQYIFIAATDCSGWCHCRSPLWLDVLSTDISCCRKRDAVKKPTLASTRCPRHVAAAWMFGKCGSSVLSHFVPEQRLIDGKIYYFQKWAILCSQICLEF